jgi:hypothetical protein
MLELMSVGDILESPRGIVIAGVNPQFENVSISVVVEILKKIDEIYFFNQDQVVKRISVLDRRTTYSIGNNFNIFLLLSENQLQKVPKSGTTIYYG